MAHHVLVFRDGDGDVRVGGGLGGPQFELEAQSDLCRDERVVRQAEQCDALERLH